MFGELGLINRKPRMATIICKVDCHFAVLECEDFDSILKANELKKMNQLIDFFIKNMLKTCSFDFALKFS
jgi:hypothetical protein